MIPAEILEVPAIAEAVKLLEVSAYTPAELRAYDKYWDIVSTQASFVHDAEARGSLQSSRATALKLLARGFSTEEVADISSLSLQEVLELQG